MRNLSWEEASYRFRNNLKEKGECLSLIASEMQMRWSNVTIGDYRIIPLKKKITSLVGKNIIVQDHHGPIENLGIDVTKIVRESPYARLLAVIKKDEKLLEDTIGSDISVGPAISTLLSFVLRSLVVSYDEPTFSLVPQGETFQILLPARFWAESIETLFQNHGGLRDQLTTYIPSPEEEQNLIVTANKVYNKLMNADEESYNSLMNAIHLYQLSFFTARIDYSLAYSLLVASIDAISSNLIKIKNEGSKKRFLRFLIDNLPDTWWEADYSSIKEFFIDTAMFTFGGQSIRDFAEGMPDPIKNELLRQADEQEKEYNKRPSISKGKIYDEERRKWMMVYLRTHLDRVLINVYESRSRLFHGGKSFPSHTLKDNYMDWMPEIFEEDILEFLNEHAEHVWKYTLDDKGRLFRNCSCGYIKEIKVMLGIRVFERMVHDSILNYIIKKT